MALPGATAAFSSSTDGPLAVARMRMRSSVAMTQILRGQLRDPAIELVTADVQPGCRGSGGGGVVERRHAANRALHAAQVLAARGADLSQELDEDRAAGTAQTLRGARGAGRRIAELSRAVELLANRQRHRTGHELGGPEAARRRQRRQQAARLEAGRVRARAPVGRLRAVVRGA